MNFGFNQLSILVDSVTRFADFLEEVSQAGSLPVGSGPQTGLTQGLETDCLVGELQSMITKV